MAKVNVSRTELVWPGKYNEDGTLKEVPRVSLPFQIIETVNESRATREARKDTGAPLFDEYEGKEGDSFEEGWRNKLIWGDNLLVMGSLLKRFAGKIDLIYIDPPFATGADFSVTTPIGDHGDEVSKTRSMIEEKAYRDTWAQGMRSYMNVMHARLQTMRRLLKPHGSIYVHLDPTVGHYVKLIMDEVFGPASFQREIVWRIGWISGYKSVAKNWIRNHDTILYYVKTPGDFTFNKEYVPYPPEYERRGGGKGKGYPIEDVWNANSSEHALVGQDSLDSIQIKSFSDEKTGYATQKNESVLRRILAASSNPHDLVADFFCGSGTTLAVAEKMGRRWIGCDLGRFAIHVTRKRLLAIQRCKPFEVLNLGKYERQYWSQSTFGNRRIEEQAYFEYLAFILKLYSARPVPGMAHVHGRRGQAMVHVGAVDAPVTINEIQSSIEECIQINRRHLHVLGWEWEMGLQDLMVDQAMKQGVSLRLLQIPREVMEQQAADQGDVTFFELAYVEAEVERIATSTGPGSSIRSSRRVRIRLADFVIPQPDLIPEDVREQISKWSDYIDYWAVDWDFQEDTFMQGWVAYRTRKDRSLPLVSDSHEYEAPGSYRVVVKVIDIFGNDTSQVVNVEIG